MKEPNFKKFPTELFSYPFSNHSEEAKQALETQFCQYINDTCNKPRKSEPHVKVGLCSVGYKGGFIDKHHPVIICPNRFKVDSVFSSIQKEYLSNWENIKWVSEVGIGVGGNVDYVAIKTNEVTGSVEDFLCVEFQAAGTTGSPWPAVLEFKEDRNFKSHSYNYGINWANEFMKTMMQQVYKKGKIIKHWNRKIVFVIQDVALAYLHAAVDTSDLRPANDDDEIHFMTYSMHWKDGKWDLSFNEKVSTNLEGINKILGGANKDNYLTDTDFIKNIVAKGKTNGIL
ncbi:Restriction endonuclease NotI [Natronincola peptidivorans]|uniref:Restriction endonuclease NotI n=1 Tax=Natronincola peptidivorans TaxID=426128 RepID=A0A1I0GVG8_9FIRM|nr:NotI family restriction endonuclease [Natronincola peptidivorans]SET74426.1 Restriction endonuclease NotI [Natronincola peptidivorans]